MLKRIFLTFMFVLYGASNAFALISTVRIDTLSDVAMGSYTPGVNTSDLTKLSTFCVTELGLLARTAITFTSQNANGTIFRVKNQSGPYYLPYSVTFYQTNNGSGTPYVMSSGVQSSSFSIITVLLLCYTFSMRITFNGSDLQGARAGNYSDLLTISVTVSGL